MLIALALLVASAASGVALAQSNETVPNDSAVPNTSDGPGPGAGSDSILSNETGAGNETESSNESVGNETTPGAAPPGPTGWPNQNESANTGTTTPNGPAGPDGSVDLNGTVDPTDPGGENESGTVGPNGSANASAAPSSGDGNGNGNGNGNGGILPSINNPIDIPSPREQMNAIVGWLRTSLDDDVNRLTELMDEAIVGVATSAEFHPDSWIAPDTGKWPVFHRFAVATLPLTAVALLYHGFGIFWVPTRQQKEDVLKETLYYGAMVAAGYFLLGGYFHALDIFATTISPGGTDFFNTTEGRVQLGFTAIVTLFLASVNFGLTLAVAVVMYAMHQAPFWIYAFWNLSWAAKCMPSDRLQSTGDFVPTLALMLAPARITAASLLLLASWLLENAEGLGHLDAQINIWIVFAVVAFGIPVTFWRSYGVFAGMIMSKSAIAKANRSASTATSPVTDRLSKGLGLAGSRAKRSAASVKQGVAKTASNATHRATSRMGDVRETAMSKAGGAMLTAKYGTKPANPAARDTRDASRGAMQSANEAAQRTQARTSDGREDDANATSTRQDSPSTTASARSKAKGRERIQTSIRASRARDNANRSRGSRSDD